MPSLVMNLLPSRENGTKRNPRQISKSKSTNVRIVKVMNKYEEEKLNSIKIGMQIAAKRIVRKVINA